MLNQRFIPELNRVLVGEDLATWDSTSPEAEAIKRSWLAQSRVPPTRKLPERQKPVERKPCNCGAKKTEEPTKKD